MWEVGQYELVLNHVYHFFREAADLVATIEAKYPNLQRSVTTEPDCPVFDRTNDPIFGGNVKRAHKHKNNKKNQENKKALNDKDVEKELRHLLKELEEEMI